jgi:hypothetical protein
MGASTICVQIVRRGGEGGVREASAKEGGWCYSWCAARAKRAQNKEVVVVARARLLSLAPVVVARAGCCRSRRLLASVVVARVGCWHRSLASVVGVDHLAVLALSCARFARVLTVVALKTMVLLFSLKAEDMLTKWSGESSSSNAVKLANLAPTFSMSESSSVRYGCSLVLRGVQGATGGGVRARRGGDRRRGGRRAGRT